MAYVVVAAFGALLVPRVVTGDEEMAPRLIAAAVAVRRFGRRRVELVAGVAAFWGAGVLIRR